MDKETHTGNITPESNGKKLATGVGMIGIGVGMEYWAQNILDSVGNQTTASAQLAAGSVATAVGGIAVLGGILHSLPQRKPNESASITESKFEPGILFFGAQAIGMGMLGLHLLNQVPESMAQDDVIHAQMAYISAGICNVMAIGGLGLAVKNWIDSRRRKINL